MSQDYVNTYRHPVDDSAMSAVEVISDIYEDEHRIAEIGRVIGEKSVDRVVSVLRRSAVGEYVSRCVFEQLSLDAIMNLNDEQRERYRELAGHPEYMTEYIDWFAHNALTAMQREEASPISSLNKGPALSLGYEIQGGLWDSIDDTRKSSVLDSVMRELPKSFDTPDFSDKYRIQLVEPRQKPVSHEVLPLRVEDDDGKLEFLWLKRRRAVADISVLDQDSQPVRELHIAKRATALVVVSHLPERTQNRLAGVNIAGLKPDAGLPSDIASAVGNTFEWSIRPDHRDHPDSYAGVVPESMSYFIREPGGRRPSSDNL